MEYDKPTEALQGLLDLHGHICFGVLLGYKAARYAIDIIGPSDNMQVFSAVENCGNDGIRYIFKYTKNDDRLTIHQERKEGWSFYNPDEKEGVTITVNSSFAGQIPKEQEQAMNYLMELPGNIIFVATPFEV